MERWLLESLHRMFEKALQAPGRLLVHLLVLQCHLKGEMAPEVHCLFEDFSRRWSLKSQFVTNAPG